MLFYADDGMMLANGRDNMEDMIKILREVERETGLEISELKSECIILKKKVRYRKNWVILK